LFYYSSAFVDAEKDLYIYIYIKIVDVDLFFSLLTSNEYIMPSAQEAANAIPSSFDIGGLSNALGNPTQIFRMLDKNNDGRVTKEDLAKLLEQYGVNGMAAKVLSSYLFKQLDANNNGTIEPSDLTHANGILTNLLKMKQN
jgi:hypothetical protein